MNCQHAKGPCAPLIRAVVIACAGSVVWVSSSRAQRVPAWTRGAVCYEAFVRSFYDSNGDGTGDLNGLIAKLDYINDGNPASKADLGASCVWLMPVAESPSYHGYDVSDYYRVEPDFGTNEDFKRFVAEAHRRGIKVLVDMVLNHSSNEVSWFQAALRDTASPYRSWYRFSPKALGKGPWGAEAWHKSPVRNEYYYGVFWSGMPDLNYDTPAVREEAKKIATFWLRDMDVDGLRLDAVPYLVEEGECMTGCPGTHVFLHEYQAHVDSVKPGAYTVGEVWGDIGKQMPYYPDQLTSYFIFEIADSLIAAVRRGSTGGLLSGYLRLQDTLPAYRWAPLLSNHDGTRSMTLLGGDLARAKVAATLLLTLPGLPFVYYGEEIGMTGDKPDPRLRTPMQWSPRPGLGFTSGTPWESAQPDSLATTVEAEDKDPVSLLNLYRRLIHLRSENEALATGRLVPLSAGSAQVVAYLRRTGDHAVLVVANLGGAPASGVAIGSGTGVLPPGSYTSRNLVGGPDGAALRVGADGRLAGYLPFAQIGPREAHVLDLVSAGTQAPSSSAAPCCTVIIRVRLPEGTGTVYLAGSLPRLGPWRPDGLALTGEERERSAQVTVPSGTAFEYKFTLGSWDREALSPTGSTPPNHRLVVSSDTLVVHEIPAFKKDPREYIADWKGSGITGRLVYWTDVPSAYLGPKRHVEIWLPPGYDSATSTRYPVLYMSDGQNLFDPRIANTGVDWGVDEAVVRLVQRGVISPVIVVGVWSTAERGPEYSPWHGAPSYARFMIEELMPRVNREFRTLTGPRNTAAMGSSMGGLLSFYLVTHHPEAFGACGCMSTHFPYSDAVVGVQRPDTTPYIVRDIAAGLKAPEEARYWFDYGSESLDASYGPTHEAVRAWLLKQGLVEDRDFVIRRYPGATHNEAAWRARLDDPLTFLFGRGRR